MDSRARFGVKPAEEANKAVFPALGPWCNGGLW